MKSKDLKMIGDLSADADEEIIFQCECGEMLAVGLDIEETYEYSFTKPSIKQINEWNEKNDLLVEDVHGQSLMWEDMYAPKPTMP